MWTHLNESRPSERSELAAWYRAVLLEQQRSGVTVNDAAEAVGVTATTLYAWRRRLGITGEEREDAAPGLVRVRVQQAAPSMQGRSPAADTGVVLHLGAGRSVELASTFDIDCLRRLIGALGSC